MILGKLGGGIDWGLIIRYLHKGVPEGRARRAGDLGVYHHPQGYSYFEVGSLQNWLENWFCDIIVIIVKLL